jgi:hypothetical protein
MLQKLQQVKFDMSLQSNSQMNLLQVQEAESSADLEIGTEILTCWQSMMFTLLPAKPRLKKNWFTRLMPLGFGVLDSS